MSRILIFGATGLVGGEALRLALADARVSSVIAPTRRALPAILGSDDRMSERAKLDNPVVDFDALSVDAPWWAADAVVCALGTTIRDAGSRAAFRRVDVEHVATIARRAREAGARAFALNSSLGADASAGNFYLRCKGEAENAVRDCGYPSVTVVRPSIIGGERARRRPMEHVGMRVLRAFEPVVPKRYRVVPAARIARCMLDAALAAEPGLHIVESEAI